MNDLRAQAGYTAYGTDPLFGALPGDYDAQQQYFAEPPPYPQPYTYPHLDPHGTQQTQHEQQTQQAEYNPYPGYTEPPTETWHSPYDYAQVHEHDYAHDSAVPTPYPRQDAPYTTGYQPAPQWTSDPYDAHWYASRDTAVSQFAEVPGPDGRYEQDGQDGQDGRYEQDGHHGQDGQDGHYEQDGHHGHHGHYDGPGPVPASRPAASPDSEEPLLEPVLEPVLDTATSATNGLTSSSATSTPGSRMAARAAGSRSRRRAPAKRSSLFTIAVPSACVMGVAGIAAASVGAVGGGTKDETATTAAADPAAVKPVAANNKMDSQLAALSADARDFSDRASRAQERIDLKERQAAEKKKREEEAARKEAARPKYLLPVKHHGLSAYFGQAGVNWMSVHTGIDFPVMTGTPVMAATDGTVRTQWNSSYGNMAIVTAPDGTETWYCHLSSTRVRSGSVKAGNVIAYSGNTGNTTGPHLHFEVRPKGGAAIDPLPWLRSHGLDPT